MNTLFGLWGALSRNIPDALRVMKSKQGYLEGKWIMGYAYIYCTEEKLENAHKWILDTLGLKRKADLIDFLGTEFIKYMQSTGGEYTISPLIPVSIAVPMRDGDISHWTVEKIDFASKHMYVKDADEKKRIYRIPNNITIKSKAKIEDLHTYWATLLKAIGLSFFLSHEGKHMLIEKLNAANNKKVVYGLYEKIKEIEVMYDKLTIKDDFYINVYMTPIDDIFLPFEVKVDLFLVSTNMHGENLSEYTCYYNPIKKIAFVNTRDDRVSVHADVRGGKIRLLLDEKLWIGITKKEFSYIHRRGTDNITTFAFALYLSPKREPKEEKLQPVDGDVIKVLLKRFGLIDAST